ncbi:hypothetical protein [Phenylobacterium sp.]|uniref:hypothetical protein n=1 Tax=Phenylobacterium sp. TaxID=1871053 RepID=UPI003568C21E
MLSDVPWSVVFIYAGDVLSVIAMAIMASTARSAWRRARPEARVPLMGARFSRNLGFGLVPTAGILILFGLGYEARRAGLEDQTAMLLLCGRIFAASFLALVQVTSLKAALATLEREGALKS